MRRGAGGPLDLTGSAGWNAGPGPVAPGVTARVDALDGLRGWLAVIVVVSHAATTLYPHAGTINSLFAADFAVRIFFVHSGFVVALKYFRSRDRRWPEVMLFRRPLRLGLPVFAAAVTGWFFLWVCSPLVRAIQRLTGAVEPQTPNLHVSVARVVKQGLIDPLLLGRSIVPGAWWTMPVELYCSVALLAVLICWNRIGKIGRRTVLVAYAVALGILAVSHRKAPSIVFVSTTSALELLLLLSAGFVLGSAIASVWARDPETLRAFPRQHRLIAAAVFIAAVLVGIFPKLSSPFLLGNRSLMELGMTAVSGVVLVAVLVTPLLRRFFDTGVSRWLGRLSFAVYLIHIAVQQTIMVRVVVRLTDAGVPRFVASAIAFSLMLVMVLAVAQVLSMTADRAALTLGKNALYRRFGLASSGSRARTTPAQPHDRDGRPDPHEDTLVRSPVKADTVPHALDTSPEIAD